MIKELYQLHGLSEPTLVQGHLYAGSIVDRLLSVEPSSLGSFWNEIKIKTLNACDSNERTSRWIKLAVPGLKESDQVYPDMVRCLCRKATQRLYYGPYVKAWINFYSSFRVTDPKLAMWEQLSKTQFFALGQTHCFLLNY
jgi:hypothetical protein